MAILASLRKPEGWWLLQARQALGDSLGRSLTEEEFAGVVAEVLAVGWLERPVSSLVLPSPLDALEELFQHQPCQKVEGALADLAAVASQVRQAGPPSYEMFLEQFDPASRIELSVYFTPAPLVRWVVAATHQLVEGHLGVPQGLGSPGLGLVDPAAGDGAFLLEALRYRVGFPARSAPWQGFEIRPGAFVAAASRVAQATEGPPSGVRLHLQDALALDSPLSKLRSPGPLVVLGNPPWSMRAGGAAPWVDRLLRHGYSRPGDSRDPGYYHFRDRPERNPKWLQSEYVRFLRVAQWLVDQAGRGVVALVLSDGIADNMTFRGLRESLLASFGSLYVLHLGGNARKGQEDASLFGIEQGACVLLGVRGGSERGSWDATVQGTTKGEKLAWLGSTGFEAVPWQPLQPVAPSFILKPSRGADVTYERALSIPEIFERGSIGVITGRDRWAVGFSQEELQSKLSSLRRGGGNDGHALPAAALAALRQDDEWGSHFRPYLFRPFDWRVLFGAPYWLERPRNEIMEEVRRNGNVALVLPRKRRHFPGAWVTEVTAGHKVASSYEGSHVFPLYLREECRPNLTPELYERLVALYGNLPSPRRILGFVYGLLWDRAYHERNREGLGRDWPRIHFPEDLEELTAQADLGWRLVEMHLGRDFANREVQLHGDSEFSIPAPGQGKPFRHQGDRLYLGSGGYLAPVRLEEVAWTVGGYPPVAGWIRRRRGRTLGTEHVDDLAQLLDVLEETQTLTQAWGA